jgi:hypothetical protein
MKMTRTASATGLIACLLLFSVPAISQGSSEQLPADDAVRLREFYRLAAQIQDQIWPAWSDVPAPLLLVTANTEFLTHHPKPPADFKPIGNDIYAHPRQFSPALLATFPAFGPPWVIVIGQPRNTTAKTSTPWLITAMHEHFHQLQGAQPSYQQGVQDLGLSHGDTSGMWMLNYPFPYEKPEVARSFAHLRELLLSAVNEPDPEKFARLTQQYKQARKQFFAQLAADDSKYFGFQLWYEGIARYTQIKVAEAAGAQYQATAEYTALPDYESFASYGAGARAETLNELKQADLAQWKRTVVYSFGATEGLLLDRMNPGWKSEYFRHPFSLDLFFKTKNDPAIRKEGSRRGSSPWREPAGEYSRNMQGSSRAAPEFG